MLLSAALLLGLLKKKLENLKFILIYAGRKSSAAGISVGVACSVVFMLILSVCFFLRFRQRINTAENDHRE